MTIEWLSDLPSGLENINCIFPLPDFCTERKVLKTDKVFLREERFGICNVNARYNEAEDFPHCQS